MFLVNLSVLVIKIITESMQYMLYFNNKQIYHVTEGNLQKIQGTVNFPEPQGTNKSKSGILV